MARAGSIRGRMLRHMVLLFAGGMLALYWAASTYAIYASDSSYDRLLAGSASSIAETLSVSENAIGVDVPYAALDMLAAAPNDKVFYRVVGTDGETITGYDDLPSDRVAFSSSSPGEPIRFFDAPYREEAVRFAVLGREIRFAGKTGKVIVQVGQSREARRGLANELTLRALLPILLVTILAMVVGWFTIGRTLRPLEGVIAGLKGRKFSDLSPISEAEVPGEIAPLISAMNQFMGRLDNNIDLLRSFIANVAHQLRTPLTAMLVQLRAAEVSQGRSARQAILDANQSAERLARLVDQLLSDAMVMHRSDDRKLESFDLKRSIERALQSGMPHSWDSVVSFSSPLPKAMVHGDEMMITEAIKNLIHNALTHGDSEDGAINLALVEDGSGFALTITDGGPGIPQDLLGEIGSRFKTGRSGSGGAGLGLAIVKQVAESHGGQLQLENQPQGGLQVRLWFPK